MTFTAGIQDIQTVNWLCRQPQAGKLIGFVCARHCIPTSPGMSQPFGILWVNCQNGAALEAALQEGDCMVPDALKGCPVHGVAWLLRMHTCLRAETW